jgi:hypothetical protein
VRVSPAEVRVPYVPAGRQAAAVRPPGTRRGLVAGSCCVPADHDAWCAAPGLAPEDRLATWERAPCRGDNYAVSAHRSP